MGQVVQYQPGIFIQFSSFKARRGQALHLLGKGSDVQFFQLFFQIFLTQCLLIFLQEKVQVCQRSEPYTRAGKMLIKMQQVMHQKILIAEPVKMRSTSTVRSSSMVA